jgi:hypothetical protein
MNNTETLATFGYTRHRTRTIQRHWQHLVHKTQVEDNTETLATFGYTRRRQYRDTGNIWVHKTQDEDNTEILATFGTQDT